MLVYYLLPKTPFRIHTLAGWLCFTIYLRLYFIPFV